MTSFHLKMVAFLLMFLDHIGVLFMVPGSGSWLLARGLGRLSFPLYAYLVSHGIRHTHDVVAYCRRFLAFAFLSELPFDMAFFGHAPDFAHQNIFFTLAFTVAVFIPWQAGATGSEQCRQQRKPKAAFLPILCMGVAAQFIHADYGFLGVLLIEGMVFADGKLVAMMLCVWCFLFLKTGWLVPDSLERMTVSAAVSLLWAWVVGMDNGKPGSRKWRKWFYAAYPAHLAVLWNVRIAVSKM